MAVQFRSVAVTADLTIAVSRDADGTLADGARARMAGAEPVRSVESFDVTGVAPGLNDVEVDASAAFEATVAADEDAAETVRAELEDRFGVSVRSLAVDATVGGQS